MMHLNQPQRRKGYRGFPSFEGKRKLQITHTTPHIPIIMEISEGLLRKAKEHESQDEIALINHDLD